MASFDEAVKVGLDFALQDKNTLVVVTADHETGGMAINGGNFDGSDLEAGWTTGDHTGLPVPVFAFGPHSLRFTGVKENSEIPIIFANLLGIEPFPRKLN
jgi:alkaline phosphatase